MTRKLEILVIRAVRNSISGDEIVTGDWSESSGTRKVTIRKVMLFTLNQVKKRPQGECHGLVAVHV